MTTRVGAALELNTAAQPGASYRNKRPSVLSFAGARTRLLRPRSMRFTVASLATSFALILTAAPAAANDYWNVWSNYLPDSGGHIAKYSAYPGDSNPEWWIRLSWNPNGYDMKFILIDDNGSWHGSDAWMWFEYGNGTYYDRWMNYDDYAYSPGISFGGCENPFGNPTDWVNCKNGPLQ